MGGEELTFIKKAFDSNYVAPLGPMVDAFEEEFAECTGIEHCAAVSGGIAAMHLALKYLGVGPGDEAVASTLTFIGSVIPIIFQGACPVFIDSDNVSCNMDLGLLAHQLEKGPERILVSKAVVL